MTDATSKPVGAGFARVFSAVAWLLLLGLLYWFFREQLEPNRRPPSQVDAAGVRTVLLQADRQGHFTGTLYINGQTAQYLLDTGASQVAVAATLAERLQLPKGRPYQTATANGVITVYSSRIAQLQIGDISLYNLDASIVPNLAGTEILLGMSALKQLEFSKKQQQLQLIQRPNL